MKKVLLATTAVAAFVAFSGAAQAQDPGRPDFGGTEGGGGAGSAFTVKTNGAVKFYLKYASAKEDFKNTRNSGFFTLVNAELEINGAATTDNGTDIETHIDFGFSGNAADESVTNVQAIIGGQEQTINLNNFAVIDELSLKISGKWGSVEMGGNDGAEDILKVYGASIAAGTGGVDGDSHDVADGVTRFVGGSAGIFGDSGDALKVTYLSPVVGGFQTGISVAYVTDGPTDPDGGNMGIGLGAKYSGSGGGISYDFALVWGARFLVVNGEFVDSPPSGLGLGVKIGGAGVSGVLGVTIEPLGLEGTDPYAVVSPGIAYAIPGGKANVSLTSSVIVGDNYINSYLVMASADYAVLPGVTLAVDLGYGAQNPDDEYTAGFTGVFRAKAAF